MATEHAPRNHSELSPGPQSVPGGPPRQEPPETFLIRPDMRIVGLDVDPAENPHRPHHAAKEPGPPEPPLRCTPLQLSGLTSTGERRWCPCTLALAVRHGEPHVDGIVLQADTFAPLDRFNILMDAYREALSGPVDLDFYAAAADLISVAATTNALLRAPINPELMRHWEFLSGHQVCPAS
ncbi:hypothetical protein [Pseudarthrobacter sp. PS3-L1]|uniref:hypothetical protein n=1 Tax=Pseudarthrobacter sp. PS3-L1 TaxID=3046207 RepID=UPI0024BB9BB3|nr:hypothetical protein [Pseudarthrobacter sp. PS3-L1]MDJ0322037.1 hypothetical protein [Pseudarthrobacter sp. PS3-L1]